MWEESVTSATWQKFCRDFLIFLHMLKIPTSPLTERRFRRAVFLSSFLLGKKKIIKIKEKKKWGEPPHYILRESRHNKKVLFFARAREQLEIAHFPLPTRLKCSHKSTHPIFKLHKCSGKNLCFLYYVIIAQMPNSQTRKVSTKEIVRAHVWMLCSR